VQNRDSNYYHENPSEKFLDNHSKAGAELLVKSYFSTYGLPITITNCANNFGPWCDPEKLIPRFITNLIDGHKVPLMGKGENIRSWLYVVDHCRAIETVLQKGVVGETYCVGGSEQTNRMVTEKILTLLGKDASMIEHVADRLGHDFRYAIDDSKLRQLGWQPEHDFDTWLATTVAWYKDNQAWWRPLKSDRPVVDRTAQQKF
jgi:dTDP-glucose 4,6-dehydratase